MTEQIFWSIIIMAVITALLRGLPFVIFKDSEHTPYYILSLGRIAPYAIIGMLVIYCLKDLILNLSGNPGQLLSLTTVPSEVWASIIVVLLHLTFRNPLISITGGVIANILLIQLLL